MKHFLSILSLLMLLSIASSQAHAGFFDIFDRDPRPQPRRGSFRNWPPSGFWDKEPVYDEEYEKSVTPHPVSVDIAPFDEMDFQTKPWLKSFKYVIVVNKSDKGPTKQTIRIYEDGYKIKTEKISTGREIFEKPRETEEEHRPDKAYWSETPMGYFTAKWLSKEHKSSSWKTPMPWAVFFDLDNGIALHEVPPAYKDILGNRASGGCVRLPPYLAQEMLERIEKTAGSNVPKVNQDGTPVLDKAGNIVYSTTTVLYDNVKEPSYGALIIVQNTER